MERTIKTQFFTFNQNNSGGYFVRDKDNGVGEYVIIEATSAEEAKNRLNKIGEKVSGFDEYCSCCGQRWSDYMDDSDGTETPKVWSNSVEDLKKGSFMEGAYVHYFDGTFKYFEVK